MAITVRIATKVDIPQCALLLGVLFGQEHEFTPDGSIQERGLDMIVGNPSVGTVFVCDLDGVIVGMVSLLSTVSTALGSKVALMEDMVVLPGFRGRGIGKMLVDYACHWAVDHGFGRLTLLTDADNETAHRFYAARGFARSEMVVFRKMLDVEAIDTPITTPLPTAGRGDMPALPAWICEECGYVYDPSEGDLEWNIRPGVAFEKLPAEWCCPVCNAGREKFRLFDSTL